MVAETSEHGPEEDLVNDFKPDLRFITTGNCRINADQAGNANFGAAVQVQQIVIVKVRKC